MTFPELVVEVGFASDPLDNPQTFTDLTHDGMSLHISRGRQHALDRIEAGISSITLKNFSNQYWPANASSPYYGHIKPGKCIRISAVYNSVTYYLFYGFIEAWRPYWMGDAGICPAITVESADLTKNLSLFEITSAGYSLEKSGTRIGNILDDFGWPAALRDIDAGQTDMAATGALDKIPAMSILFDTADGERGRLFMAADGKLTFMDRHATLFSPYNTSQATFGDALGDNRYTDIEPSLDDEFIFNTISVSRAGGVEQVAEDIESQNTFGIRNYSKTLTVTTDAEASSHAYYLLDRYKDCLLRIKTLVIKPSADPLRLWPKVLGYDIGTKITLKLSQASINQNYHIEGITHDFDAATGEWITTWQLSDAEEKDYWILGSAGNSELGLTTTLLY